MDAGVDFDIAHYKTDPLCAHIFYRTHIAANGYVVYREFIGPAPFCVGKKDLPGLIFLLVYKTGFSICCLLAKALEGEEV
jgi:hypothetical protein